MTTSRSYREVEASERIDRTVFDPIKEWDERRGMFGWHGCPRCGHRLRFRLKDFDRHDGIGVQSGLPADVVRELNDFRPVRQGADNLGDRTGLGLPGVRPDQPPDRREL